MSRNDVTKFQEGIAIIIEFCLARQIQLIGISNYFENKDGSEILLKIGIHRQLIEYFAGIPLLKQLCQLLKLDQLSYNPKSLEERRDQFNKDFIYYHLFQDIQYNKISNGYFNTINNNGKQNMNQKDFILLKLSQIAQAQLVFPQILCALEISTNNSQLIFTLEPNVKFIKMLKQFERYNDLQQIQQKLSETTIIEEILFHTNTNINENYLFYYKLQIVQSLYNEIHKIDYSKVQPNLIYQRLLDLENLYKKIYQERIEQKYKRLTLIIKLSEYNNRNLVFPGIIKYLQIKQFHSQNVVLSLVNSYKIYKDVFKNQNKNCNNDGTVINESMYEELKSQYPFLISSKQVEQLLEQMLKLIYENREQCQEQLVYLFREQNTMKFMKRVISLKKFIKQQEPFEILFQLQSYADQFNQKYPLVKKIIFHSDLEKAYAKKNANILLNLLVDKDIVIVELIGLLKFYHCHHNNPPEIKLSTSFKTFSFFENNCTIKNLLSEYSVPQNETYYQLLNQFLSKIQFKNKLSQSDCIINRLEAIQKQKSSLIPNLYQLFQQESVINLIKQLEISSDHLKQTDQAYLVYEILKELRTEISREEEQVKEKKEY